MQQFKIDDKVFFLNVIKENNKIRSKEIIEAIVVGSDISGDGYLMYRLKLNNNKVMLKESKHVHLTEEKVQEHLNTVGERIDKGEAYQQEAMETLKAIRESVIGKPEFPELAKQVTGG